MEIYVVQPGDTLASIANRFGVPLQVLENINQLRNPDELVVGQTIVILYPSQIYTVRPGDSLYQIAVEFDTSVIELYQNNPQLSSQTEIYPGDVLVIQYAVNQSRSISVLGYAYPYIDRQTLIKTLPYLTYLSVFTYGFTADGGLIAIEDQDVVDLALDYGVAPLMVLSPLDESGNFSNVRASELLNDPVAQETLIQNLLGALYEKGYQGVDLDFEYLFAQDREAYVSFVQTLRKRLNAQGYVINVDLAPKVRENQEGLLYEGLDYYGLGAASNYVLVMTYEWGYTYGPPMAVSPIRSVRTVLDYAVTEIDTYKIFMGMNNYGYDWPLPYERGVTAAKTISNVAAVELAKVQNVDIQYDEWSQAPYFYYIAEDGVEHVVWFEDARSIDARLKLIEEYDLNGAGYWNVMKFFPQNWMVLNALYNIRKVI